MEVNLNIVDIWKILFPVRGSIQSLSNPETILEVSYLGFIRLVGTYDGDGISISTGLTAKQVFDILPGGVLVKSRFIVVRNRNEPNIIRCLSCPGIGYPITVTFPRSPLETLVSEQL